MMASLRRQSGITLQTLLSDFVIDRVLADVEVTGITGNSVQVNPGDLFVAQAGFTQHAIDYAAAAIKAGAIAVIYDADDHYCKQRVLLLQKTHAVEFIGIPDLAFNCGLIAAKFYADPSKNFKLIGVTGTDGKTSVTHLLVQALTRMGKKAGSVGTLGYGIANKLKMTRFTTPDAITLQSILSELSETGCEYVVMEVSSHALEQHRVSGCHFDVAVLTNLGSDHLDYHGDQAQYRDVKSRLFDMPGLTARVLNLADEFGRSLQSMHKGNKVMGYSADLANHKPSQVNLVFSEMMPQGIKISASTANGLFEIQTGLIGKFNIDNLLACLSVLLQLGFKHQQIETSMQNLQPIPGRMEYFPSSSQLPAVVIDFAHTEQALEACLSSLKNYTRGRLICVFGCGGDRDQSKRPKMAAVAERLADQVIVTDDNPRNESAQHIMRDILSGFSAPEQARVIHDRQKAIEIALADATPQDLVVIAGKGHEEYQIVGNQRLPFSDRYVVRQAFQKRVSL